MLFQLTGNPFVDTGLYVLAHLAKVDHPQQLTIEKVRRIYGDGTDLAKANARLKSFTMVFGTNGPLTQTGYRPQGRKKVLSEKNLKAYTGVLSGFLGHLGEMRSSDSPCEICAGGWGLDFDAVVREALTNAGVEGRGMKQVGREWFPLAGSIGNDAQALPAASRALSICAKCLFAVHYMPLGLMLMRGRLVCFQSNHPRIAAELTSDIVTEYREILSASSDKVEMLGRKEQTTGVTRRLLSWMTKVQEVRREESLPDSATLTLWLFSNAGANPDCRILEIPNRSLQFLWQARKQGFERDLLALLAGESKSPDFQLLTSIQIQRDYPRLYPFKTFTGASPGLFALYHQAVLGESVRALKAAQTVAQAALAAATAKEHKKLQKAKMLQENMEERKRLRKLMLDLAKEGQFCLAEYADLFPMLHTHPIQADFRGWRTIGYYLRNPDGEIPDFSAARSGGDGMKPHPKIKQIAKLYFDDYLARKSIEHFERHVIDGFQRTFPNGVRWLRDDVYLNLAKNHPGFTIQDWDEFIQDENGQPQASELLFQVRLELANLYRNYVQTHNKSN